MKPADLRKTAKLCRKIGIRRLRMGSLEMELTDHEPARVPRGKKADDQSEIPVTGPRMPSDEEMMEWSTPFFVSPEEKQKQNEALDEAEKAK